MPVAQFLHRRGLFHPGETPTIGRGQKNFLGVNSTWRRLSNIQDDIIRGLFNKNNAIFL